MNELKQRVKDLLLDIEWKGQEYLYSGEVRNECPCCISLKTNGHNEDCELANLIKELD